MKTVRWFIHKGISKIKFIYRRKRNIKELYIYPDVQGGWIKYPNIVYGKKGEGSFFDPYANYEGGKFVLYLSDRKNGSIVRTESGDGIHWDKTHTILWATPTSDWEKIVNRGVVRRFKDKWFLWYTGQIDGRSAIGVAISEDGIHYERYSHNPVIIPEYDYEKASVMNPSVILDSETGNLKMWYCAGEQCEPDVICYATSSDGVNWKKHPENPVFTPSNQIYDRAKVGGCDVFQTPEGNYGMLYIGYQNIDNARICYAHSDNGVSGWIRSVINPLISPSRGGWDAHAVYKPAYLFDEKEKKGYIWYNGRKGLEEYIGLATKQY